jgi:ankyrin repeat protein
MGGQGLDATNEGGETALHWAVFGGHEAVVTFLLSQGAQSTIRGVHDRTPLMEAAAGGHVGMLQMFLELQGGQGLDEEDDFGKTALSLAVEYGRAEAAGWLLRNGAGASIRASSGMTPLMFIGRYGRLGALQTILQAVGEQGLRERDVRGYTALHWAARENHDEAVQALLLAGADPTIKDNEGRAARALAEEKGHGECTDVFEVSMPVTSMSHKMQQCLASVIIPSTLHGMSRTCT